MSDHPQKIPIFKKKIYLIMIIEFQSLKSSLLRGKQLLKETILSWPTWCHFSDIGEDTDSFVWN